jgi:hypothetical protein
MARMAEREVAAKASRAGFGLPPQRIRASTPSRRWARAIGALPERMRQASSAKVPSSTQEGAVLDAHSA